MSNLGDADEQKDETLAALHGLGAAGSGDDSEHDEAGLQEDPQLKEAESRDDAGASSAASGFVGMLAKEGAAGTGTGGGTEANGPPLPSASARAKPDAIQMARELRPDELPATFRPAGAARTKRPVKKVPGWYHGAMPVMFTMGAVLLLIGAWAVGGLVYMATTRASKAQPAYPLIQRDIDDDDVASYTGWSKGSTAALSVCVPVALAMEVMGMMMLKQIGAAKRASGGAAK